MILAYCYVNQILVVILYIDNVCMNHLFYADDICLLAPSAAGIQQLINICEKYGIEHDIFYFILLNPNVYLFYPVDTNCHADFLV